MGPPRDSRETGHMDDEDGFRTEAAEQCGFQATDPGIGAFDGTYSCTTAQLIAFAKACERKGRAEASAIAQRKSHEYRTSKPLCSGACACAMDVLAGELERMNAATDAELAPILTAEEERFMTARGYIRAGLRWVRP